MSFLKEAILTAKLFPRIVKPSGNTMLYGMTAGHILAQQPFGRDNFDHVEFCDEQDEEHEEDEGFYSGEEEYELDNDAIGGEEEVQDMATPGDETRNFSQSTKLGHLWWPIIGCVSAASNEETAAGHDLDWALVDFDESANYRPNLLILFDGEGGPVTSRPLTENGRFTEDGSRRPVFVLSGTGGVKSGTLSTSLSFLMMGPAKAFTKTYTLALPRGSGKCLDLFKTKLILQALSAGDCGSWVVDPSTCEVYGHVVASDTMGDTYVVPLDATLRDMEEKLEAAVSLPTEADIHRWLAQHKKAGAEHVTIPIKSKKKQVAFNESDAEKSKSPRDLQKLAGHSQSVTFSAPSAVKSRNEGSISQDTKDTSDERSKSSSAKSSKDINRGVQQKTTQYASTQQTSPTPHSIQSMFSNFGKESSRNAQQKDGEKGKNISSSKDNKPPRSGSSMKPATTLSPSSTVKTLKNNTEKSNSKKIPPPPHISTGFPAPPAPRAIPEHRVYPPGPTPGSPRMSQSERILPPAPRPPPPHSKPRQTSYEGYTFTKVHSNQTGLKETWAIAKMVPMPVSQDDLKDEIKRNRKKNISALDEYNDRNMKGFKRKHVDNLIRERTKIDGDYGYEYVLASIKLESRKPKGNNSETLSMQVILKRQLTADFLHDPLTGSSMDFHAKLPSQVIDLTSGDEPEMAIDHGGGSQVGYQGSSVPFTVHPQMFPLAHSQFAGRGVPYVDDRRSLFHPSPLPLGIPDPPAQDMRQSPRRHSPPLPHEGYTQGHFQKIDTSKDRKKKISKEKAGTIVEISNESRRKPHAISNSPSLSDLSSDSKSDHSWAKTDATSVFSGESRESRKEKTSQEASKESFQNKYNIERTPYRSEIEQPVWRESKSKEHRRSSLSPARKSRGVSSNDLDLGLERGELRPPSPQYSHGMIYRDHGQYDMEPAISFPTSRAPRHRRSSVSPVRISHRRALTYDLDRSLAHDSRDLVPVPRRPDLYSQEAELAREREEWERRRLHRRVWNMGIGRGGSFGKWTAMREEDLMRNMTRE